MCPMCDDDWLHIWVVCGGAVVEYAHWHEGDDCASVGVREGDVVITYQEHECAGEPCALPWHGEGTQSPMRCFHAI